MSEILQAKLSSVRRKQIIVATATGITAAIGAFILILSLSMLIDFWATGSGLPFSARAALLALNLAAVAWILLYSIFGPVLYGPNDDEIALMVEDAEPAFRTRLIASVQLSRPNAIAAGSSVSLIRAMIAQAESLAGPMDFARVIKTQRLVRIAILTVVILIAATTIFAWGGDVSKDLLKRSLFLSDTPVPRKTGIVPITANLLIAKGDDIELIALAERAIPEQGTLYIRTTPEDSSQPSRKQEFKLERIKLDPARLEQIKRTINSSDRTPEQRDAILKKLQTLGESAPLFSATVENVQEPFEYRVRLNDNESETFKVRVLPRPAITRVEAKQVYPAYTGHPIESRSLGDLTILQGSKLQLAITVNKDLRRASKTDATPNFVHLIGSDKDLPLALDATDPKVLTGEIDIPKSTTGFSINLTDQDGLKSKDPAIYRIDLVPDKAPVVRIVFPTRKEVALVREGKQKIIFLATDDFAIGSAALKFKLDDGPETVIKLDLKGQHPKSFPGEYNWKIADIQSSASTRPMMEGSVIEYWVEVEDTKDAPNGGPNKGVSEHYMLRVVSREEFLEAIRLRITDIGSGLRTAVDDQEAAANKVKTILLEKQAEPAPTPK
jgi:hypothetical protein